LVYSTCTINPWENEKVIEGFLKESPEFVLEDFGEHLPQSLKSSVIRDGMIQLIPGLHNVDGFFIAKLRRIGL
jgi:16S rRNA (cytosine967-C5)-methyltransferase